MEQSAPQNCDIYSPTSVRVTCIVYLHFNCGRYNVYLIYTCDTCAGEKMTDEEVSELLIGQEDTHGNVNYEGTLETSSQYVLCLIVLLYI
jgi:hypothetical protein